MRLSTKGQYGVRAMFDLASHFKDNPVPLRQISEREGISLNYLEQLFLKLRKAGLVESVRGPGGGYLLKKRPKEIRISDIARAVEESLVPISCIESQKNPKCHRINTCIPRLLWKELGEKILGFLDSMTLADLLQTQRRELQPQKHKILNKDAKKNKDANYHGSK
ncbi:Rrf2 family transcriptional regulator [bacterium]|nr:Rrf2 family transcriptional regulator [bacterium]